MIFLVYLLQPLVGTNLMSQAKTPTLFRFIKYAIMKETQEPGEGTQDNMDGMFRFEKRMK